MNYVFGDFVLDLDRGELRGRDGAVAVEPRAFALLAYMVEHHGRLIDRDELVTTIWEGRFVSDSAISTAVKAARRAIGDDGTGQTWLKTLRGRGFRFDGDVRLRAAAGAAAATGPEPAPGPAGPAATGAAETPQPRIAVLPFPVIGAPERFQAIGDAIPSELIASLSRLHWLQVIARGSSFRFRGDAVEPASLRGLLGAGYCLTGSVEMFGMTVAVDVEVSDTRTGAVIWADRFGCKAEDLPDLRPRIVAAVIAALDLHIPQHEAEKARLRSTADLDAWGSYHLGLTHVYRFNAHDNGIAERHFERAIALDPGFAGAHAALSFAKFQNAFLRLRPDREAEVRAARASAERALDLDPTDPQSNFAMGRVSWLEGRPGDGLPWLDTAIARDPNYARGFYARGVMNVIRGCPVEGLADLGSAQTLSPLDPLLAPLLSARALAELQLGDAEAAIRSAERGALTPRAHYVAMFTAIIANAMAGKGPDARRWAEFVFARRPDANVAEYFRGLPFEDLSFRRAVAAALASAGLPPGD